MLALGAVILLLGSTLAVAMGRSIVQPLERAVALARRVVAGDLASRVENRARDETGQLLDALGEITLAGEQQSEGIEQVNMAIGQMDEMTQQNAALVEQAAAAASMREQAQALLAQVSRFTVADTPAAVLAPARPKPVSAANRLR